MMHEIKIFERSGVLSLAGFPESGADWLERYKPFINDGKTIVVSPHKVYGPETDVAIRAMPRQTQARTRYLSFIEVSPFLNKRG
jgi:hypothetical protein